MEKFEGFLQDMEKFEGFLSMKMGSLLLCLTEDHMQHVHQVANNVKIKVLKYKVFFFSALNQLYDKTVQRFLTLINHRLLPEKTLCFSFLP